MKNLLKFLLSALAAVLITTGPSGALLLSVANMVAAEAIHYTCGMHPMIVVDEPGLCPICQMELTVQKNGSDHQDRQIIEIDPTTSQKMGIRTAEAIRRPMTFSIHTVGLVDYEEPGQQAVNTKVSGWVENLMVNQSGQEVDKGQPLLSIYSPELVAAQNELLLAQKNFQKMKKSGFPEAEEDARSLLTASRNRLKFWDISMDQINHLESSGTIERTLVLHAPAKGIVSQKRVRKGEFVTAGQEIMEISSLENIWIYADIYENELSWVKTGQTAEVIFPFLTKPIQGTVTMIYPYLDAATRTIKVRIDLANPGYELKPNMFADVDIKTVPTEPTLSIPVEAVLYTGLQETVFLDLGEGKFKPYQVTTGRQDENGYVEIISGLNVGDRVVTSAQFLLDSESKLREAIQKMLDPVKPQDAQQKELEDLF